MVTLIKVRKICAFIILLCIISSTFMFNNCSALSNNQNDIFGEKVENSAFLENSSLRLEIASNGRMTLLDKVSDYKWLSNPSDETPDNIAFGVNKQRIESQILISYLGTSVVIKSTSFAQSAAEDGSYCETFLDGESIVCVYNFKGLGFIIPVRYSISNSDLVVTVKSEEIKEQNKKNRLVDFTINPFFGAGTQNENGYIMIPDGSGATINFNNGKTVDNRLTLDVMYGNKAKVYDTKPPSVKPVLVPCFGISKQINGINATMTAFISDGAFGGNISTNVSGRETGCNYVYFTYIYRESAVDTMLDRTYAAKTKIVVSDKPVSNKKYTTCYTFGHPQKSGISSMADALRKQIFSQTDKKSPTEMPLYLDMIMGVRVKQNFLGIPYHTLRPLTTISEAETIIGDFSSAGIEKLEVRMTGLSSDGIIDGKIDSKLQINSKLGKAKDLSKLNKSDSVTAYPDLNPVEFNRSGNGSSKFFSGSLDLLLDAIKVPEYLLASGVKNEKIDSSSLIIPKKLNNIIQKLNKDLSKKEIGALSPSVLAKGTYCNYSKKNTSDIVRTAAIMTEALETIDKNNKILLEAPAFYAWEYTDSIIGLPDESSHYNLCDSSIPLLQMVLSGYIPYAADNLNLSGSDTSTLLQCIRTGSAPSFSVMAAEYEKVNNTDAKNYYSSSFSSLQEKINNDYNTINTALKDVYGLQMTDYYVISKDVTASCYSNGITILVNNSESSYVYNGTEISAYSYAVTETGEGR